MASTITGTVTTTVNIGGGTFTSPLTIADGGTVSVSSGGTIAISSNSVATIVDYGVVSASSAGGVGIDLNGGGYITVGAAGIVHGKVSGIEFNPGGNGTVVNAGTVKGDAGGDGIFFGYGDVGSVNNSAGTSLIEGDTGVYIASGGSIGNSGTIEGTNGNGVQSGNYGAITVTNAGTILGSSSSDGIFLGTDGGIVDNNAGTALIEGYNGIYLAQGSLHNLGTIEATGSNGSGVGGNRATVTNAGTILGGTSPFSYGISLHSGGTVVDSGSISGHDAIYLGGTGNNLLEIYAGYKLSGSIVAHGTANRLELGSSGSVGTVSGLSSTFANFKTITVDAGSRWSLAGANTIASGVTLDDGGTVFAASLANHGSIIGPGGFTIGSAGTLLNSGSIGTSLTLLGGGYISNQSTGTIEAGSGNRAIRATSSAAVVNAGFIYGANDAIYTVQFAGFNTVTNTGTIKSGYGYAIDLRNGGIVTNTGAGATISGAGGVAISSAYGGPTSVAGTVTNSGMIAGSRNSGVYLYQGSVDNQATGLITSDYYGVRIDRNVGTVTNAGTIEGNGYSTIENYVYMGNTYTFTITAYGDGVFLEAGGSVSNTGLIEATSAGKIAVKTNGSVYVYNGGGGRIAETGSGGIGVYFYSSGTIENKGTIAATGSGGIGITLTAGGTVIDSGTIVGAGGTAAYFGGSGANLLELEAGYKLTGSVIGSGSATNTLELSGTLGAVSVSYNSLGLTNFSFVDFANPTGGHDQTLVIGNTASLPGTIQGFTAFHDIIDLTGVTYHAGASVTETGDVLTLVSGAETLTLQLAGNYPGILWEAKPDSGTGTDIEPACFARGTLILTEKGERPVEALQIGDRVVTASGALRPVKWIGRRSYSGAFLLRNPELWPVWLKAEALGPGTPKRDLYLSGKHALLLEGLLIPAECLVNGRSIRRAACPEAIEYFHIELATHDAILAEWAPAETFVDCDDRGIFHNAREFALLYPGEEPPRWAFCAPRVEAGRELNRLRGRLLARAGIDAPPEARNSAAPSPYSLAHWGRGLRRVGGAAEPYPTLGEGAAQASSRSAIRPSASKQAARSLPPRPAPASSETA